MGRMGKYLAGAEVVTAEGKGQRKNLSCLSKMQKDQVPFYLLQENCFGEKKGENTSLNVLEPCSAFDLHLQLNKLKPFPLSVTDVR